MLSSVLGFSHLPDFKTLEFFDQDPICSTFLLENETQHQPHEHQAERAKKSVWKDRSIGLLNLERIANGKVLYLHIATQRWCSDLQFLHPGALTCICGWLAVGLQRFHRTEIKNHLKLKCLKGQLNFQIPYCRCVSKKQGMVCWLMAYLLVSLFVLEDDDQLGGKGVLSCHCGM